MVGEPKELMIRSKFCKTRHDM